MDKFNYYMPSNNKGARVISVVLLVDGSQVARGVSVCSSKDQFCKKKGREIAEGRAVKAMATGRGSDYDSQLAGLYQKRGLPMEIAGKFSFLPELTEYEKTIISKKGD